MEQMEKAAVFKETYEKYIQAISKIDLKPLADRLGGRMEQNRLVIPMLGQLYNVSGDEITDASGRKPPFDICVILSKYVLLCPDDTPPPGDWASYRDFKDSAPLLSYFLNEVEQPLADHFSGKSEALKQACDQSGGYPPGLSLAYDITAQFDVLPKIPLLMLFNDADSEFPATCSVLFRKSAERYLDAECLAMVGACFFNRLQKR